MTEITSEALAKVTAEAWAEGAAEDESKPRVTTAAQLHVTINGVTRVFDVNGDTNGSGFEAARSAVKAVTNEALDAINKAANPSFEKLTQMRRANRA